ncbi:MAG: ATP-binding cassette domain-containing protein, partial [Syntrophothermus sp.]
ACAAGRARAARIGVGRPQPRAGRAPGPPRRAPDPGREAIELSGVRFSHPGRPEVLRGVDLRLEPGETVAMVGASGGGKSTLVSLLLRLAEQDEGVIACGGVDLRDVDPAEWRRRIAWVPQRPTLFAGTIEDNIRLAAPGAPEERVLIAAEDAGLLEIALALPQGMDTPVGEGGRRLSAGQAQRVGLARAFLSRAPLLLLDEPTAHLDGESELALAATIERLAAGRTTLLVAHRPELARRADRVVELREGRIGAPGTTSAAVVAA